VAVAHRRLGPQRLGDDLDHLAGAAILGGPGALLEPAHHHHHAAALGQRLGGVLGLVAPDHHGEERRLTIAPAGDGTRNVARAMPPSVQRTSGVVGEVAGDWLCR
jgi:hypothetical protein